MTFESCSLGTETARAVGRALGDGKFPSLTHFSLHGNSAVGDEGVAVLAMGLRVAPRTRLVGLDMGKVCMTEVGVDAFVSLLGHGVLWRLESLSLSQNEIPEKGALALTCVLIRGVGLPALRRLKLGRVKKMDETRLVMLAVALTQCPRLQKWDMDSGDEFLMSDYKGEEDRPYKIMQGIRAILRSSRSDEMKVEVI